MNYRKKGKPDWEKIFRLGDKIAKDLFKAKTSNKTYWKKYLYEADLIDPTKGLLIEI